MCQCNVICLVSLMNLPSLMRSPQEVTQDFCALKNLLTALIYMFTISSCCSGIYDVDT